MSSRYHEDMAIKHFLPFKMGYLTDWMIQKAKDELNETEENRGPAIIEFRKLISKDTKLNCLTDDAFLLQFLRARKFNVQKAMERLQRSYTVKKNHPEVYPDKVDIDRLKDLLKTGAASYLPYRDENGCVIIIYRMFKWDPDLFSIAEIFSGMTAFILNAVEDPATQVCGVRVILDVGSISLKQLRVITPRYIKLMSYALSNSLPVRFKGIHVCNEPFVFGYLFNILKYFLTGKISNRFHFHGGDHKHLQKYIPKEILTGEYDGDNKHFDGMEDCLKTMESFYDKYDVLLQFGYP